MLIFPSLLVKAAQDAGMKTPSNPDDFDADAYPHFNVFCNVQLGVRMSPGAHWENAKVIANIPNDKIKTITYNELIELGFVS